MAKYIVTEHGEVIDIIEDTETMIKVSHGDRVLRKKTVDYLKDTKKIKTRFIKVNDQASYLLSDQAKYISLLLRFIGYRDGILKFNNGIYLTNSHIEKIFGINRRNTINVLENLIKNDVIHKHKIKNKNYYTFNPWIASKGQKVDIDLYEEFQLSEWASKSQEPSDYETEYEGN